MKRLIACTLLALATFMALPAFADGHSTMRVVVVQTDDAAAYADQLKKGKALIAGIDDGLEIRAWQATFAGERTGAIVVAVSHAGGLAAFAESWEKVQANEEVAAWIGGLDGMRTITSDSLYSEIPLD